MMESISNFWHIFRSIRYIRILYSPVISWISSFKTAVMEIFIKLLFAINRRFGVESSRVYSNLIPPVPAICPREFSLIIIFVIIFRVIRLTIFIILFIVIRRGFIAGFSFRFFTIFLGFGESVFERNFIFY